MENLLFKGASTALITPFCENRKIDYDKFEELVNIQLNSGCSAIIICGTTAETPTLDENEKEELVKRAINICKNKISVIVGTGSNDTLSAVKMTEKATDLGADGILVVTPYYNKTSQSGLVEHYKAVSYATDKPIIVYNVPSRTGMSISLETYIKLQEIDNLAGIKEASGNLALLAALIDCCGDRYKYYCGNDDIILPFLSIGGDGIISVIGNLIPKKMNELCNCYFNGDISAAAKIQLKYTSLINALSLDINPMPIKYAMEKCGLPCSKCRLPLTEIDKEIKHRIDIELIKLGLTA